MDNVFFYNGIQRLDFLGNPNKTAALIAMTMVAVWALPFILRRSGFWIALCLFVPLGVYLMHTFSRGGVLAALCGLGAMVIALVIALLRNCIIALFCRSNREVGSSVPARPSEAQRSVRKPTRSVIPRLGGAPLLFNNAIMQFRNNAIRIIAVLLAVLVIAISAVFIKAHTRFSQSAQQDRSISNRLVIWKEAPTMMKDSPSGWGLGRAGEAYMEWYQPLDFAESYGSLVNSHLTWLVETGWMGRFLYISAWLLALMLCRPMREVPWMSVCLGIWVTFLVATTFSFMTKNLSLWILPVCALVAVVVVRIYYRKWDLKMWWIVPTGAAAILAVFLACAHESPVRKGKGYVVLNRSGGEVSWWVLPDKQVMGSMPGRVLRHSDEMRGIAIAESFDTLPRERNGMRLAVAGKAAQQLVGKDLSQLEMLVLLNPEISSKEIASLPANVKIYVGEYTSHPHTNATIVEGASVFLSNWPALLPWQQF